MVGKEFICFYYLIGLFWFLNNVMLDLMDFRVEVLQAVYQELDKCNCKH